jgi:hypothetical protein
MEGWRQESNDRVAERVVLTALAEEFAENRARLDGRMGLYEAQTTAQRALLALIRGAPSVPPDSLDGLFRWSIRTGNFDPANGVLNSILASGDLRLIRDPLFRITFVPGLG